MAAGHPLRSVAAPDPLKDGPTGRRGRSRRRAELEQALGHAFADPALLSEALTHASAVGTGSRPRRSYERLEFLGDRVLGLVIAHLLIERFPADAEGALTQRHAALVQKAALIAVAERLALGRWIEIGRHEAESGGRTKPALLADCCEAVIGALYLDGGLEAARRFIGEAWEPLLAEALAPPRDAKTTLQEWAQARGLEIPTYEVVARSGPPHDPCFTVEARVPGLEPTRGQGRSKRVAEREAAEALLGQARERDA